MRGDVIVIGGGIVGLACARELAAAGASVNVLEAAPALAQGSTARANGGVRAQFTTAPNIAFSSFSIDTLNLARAGAWAAATANVAGSVVLCLVAVTIGFAATAALQR